MKHWTNSVIVGKTKTHLDGEMASLMLYEPPSGPRRYTDEILAGISLPHPPTTGASGVGGEVLVAPGLLSADSSHWVLSLALKAAVEDEVLL